ncbi:MAG: hypothetical protein ACFFAU_01190 [Candidatus Hodarchaeota archaeon]
MARKINTIETVFDRLYYSYKLKGLSLLAIMNITVKIYALLEEIERLGE